MIKNVQPLRADRSTTALQLLLPGRSSGALKGKHTDTRHNPAVEKNSTRLSPAAQEIHQDRGSGDGSHPNDRFISDRVALEIKKALTPSRGEGLSQTTSLVDPIQLVLS